MKRAGAFVALVATLAACPEQVRPQQDPNVIATVNSESILRADFERELSRELQPMEGAPPRTPEQVELYKQTLLDTMTERVMLLQAAKAANVTVSADEVDRRVLALSSEYPAETFDAALAQSQTSKPELIRQTRTQLTIEKLFAQQVYARVAVTEEELRREYENRAEELMEPEQVRAQQIVVKELAEAKKLKEQLWQGKKFPELARKYSLSPDAKVGGDLGMFPRGVMPPQFDDVLFKLPLNQVSDVISSEYGFHLFRVVEKKPARKRELEEVRGQLEEKLLAQLKERAQAEYVKQLKAKAEVKVNDQVLLSVTGKTMRARQTEP